MRRRDLRRNTRRFTDPAWLRLLITGRGWIADVGPGFPRCQVQHRDRDGARRKRIEQLVPAAWAELKHDILRDHEAKDVWAARQFSKE